MTRALSTPGHLRGVVPEMNVRRATIRPIN